MDVCSDLTGYYSRASIAYLALPITVFASAWIFTMVCRIAINIYLLTGPIKFSNMFRRMKIPEARTPSAILDSVLKPVALIPEDVCLVCRDDMTRPVKLPCGHLFCDLCIRTVLCQSDTCPYCRRTVFSFLQTADIGEQFNQQWDQMMYGLLRDPVWCACYAGMFSMITGMAYTATLSDLAASPLNPAIHCFAGTCNLNMKKILAPGYFLLIIGFGNVVEMKEKRDGRPYMPLAQGGLVYGFFFLLLRVVVNTCRVGL